MVPCATIHLQLSINPFAKLKTSLICILKCVPQQIHWD